MRRMSRFFVHDLRSVLFNVHTYSYLKFDAFILLESWIDFSNSMFHRVHILCNGQWSQSHVWLLFVAYSHIYILAHITWV